MRSLDTTIIKIRDVTAINSKTGAFIKRDGFPVISDNGYMKWKESLDLVGEISCIGTTTFQLMESIKPGISSLSTNFTKGLNRMLININNLDEYITGKSLQEKITDLTVDQSYISSTALYDCVKSLSKMDTITENIGPMIIFLNANGSNFDTRGYISTINPGKYHNYYSTLGFTPVDASGNNFESLNLDIRGFDILPSSKMRIDINANVRVNTLANVNFSTFLYKDNPIGTPVVVDSAVNFTMSKFTYFLTGLELGSARQISLKHRINNNATIDVQPISVHATLINMD